MEFERVAGRGEAKVVLNAELFEVNPWLLIHPLDFRGGFTLKRPFKELIVGVIQLGGDGMTSQIPGIPSAFFVYVPWVNSSSYLLSVSFSQDITVVPT
jgi:hypothetical protein